MGKVTSREIPKDLVSLTKAAQHIGVARRTIYNWLERGFIELYRTAGGSPRVSLADLVRHCPRPKAEAQEQDATAART